VQYDLYLKQADKSKYVNKTESKQTHARRAVRIKFRDLLPLNTLVDLAHLKQPLTDKQTE